MPSGRMQRACNIPGCSTFAVNRGGNKRETCVKHMQNAQVKAAAAGQELVAEYVATASHLPIAFWANSTAH